MAGAGRLAATVWKDGQGAHECDYNFNLQLMNPEDGSVSQRFSAGDLVDLVALVRLLSIEIVYDGCLGDELRITLRSLANQLDDVVLVCSTGESAETR